MVKESPDDTLTRQNDDMIVINNNGAMKQQTNEVTQLWNNEMMMKWRNDMHMQPTTSNSTAFLKATCNRDSISQWVNQSINQWSNQTQSIRWAFKRINTTLRTIDSDKRLMIIANWRPAGYRRSATCMRPAGISSSSMHQHCRINTQDFKSTGFQSSSYASESQTTRLEVHGF